MSIAQKQREIITTASVKFDFNKMHAGMYALGMMRYLWLVYGTPTAQTFPG